MKRKPKVHWEPPVPKGARFRMGAFCTKRSLPFTTHTKSKVTCLRCRNLMLLHEHLPEPEVEHL
jgi:hypothetical protein